MNRIIAFILAAVMLLNLAACAPADGGNTTGAADNTTAAGSDTTGQLLVGYGKTQIDPTESVPLQGYGATEKRMSTGLRSHMYQIAVAITTPDGNTGIVIAADICSANYETTLKFRQGIEAECGVPADNVIISSIHQRY